MKPVLVPFLFLLSVFSYGQFNESIQSGRPGQSIGGFTVGKNVLQFQQGVDYLSSVEPNITQKGFLTNNVVRFGILETVELSVLVDYRQDKTRFNTFDTTNIESQGLSDLHLGFRVNINEQKGWIPVTAFQMRLKTPHISEDYKTNNIAPVMIFVANWDLPKAMSLATNWIVDYNGINANPTGKYIINFGFPVYKNLSGFIGNYGQIYQSNFQTRFEGGFALLVNTNLALDIFAGFGENQNVHDFFLSTGVSYRFLNFRK